MEDNFRNQVFQLCKKLIADENSKKIALLIHDMTFSTQGELPLHGEFAYIAKHLNNQFQGFLYVDDNAKQLSEQLSIKLERLSFDERNILEQCNRTLIRFIELCLEDINKKSSVVGSVMNPYSFLTKISFSESSQTIISDEEMSGVVREFKNGKAYKTLYNSDIIGLFDSLGIEKFKNLIIVVKKEMGKCFEDEIPSYLAELPIKILNKSLSSSDVIMAFSLLVYALRESLGIVCQLFYEAICGIDLRVLDNNIIISIDEQLSNVICDIYKVLIQGVEMGIIGEPIGSTLLLDCYPKDEIHIHEFGMITAMTCSIDASMGDTTRFTFIKLDEEFINIHNIIKVITGKTFPKVYFKKE